MVMTGWPRRGAWVPMVCLLWACGLGEPAAQEGSAVLTPDQFIDVYTALRTAAGEVEDTLAFDSVRDEILRAHGVTEDDLIEFARVHGRDIKALAVLWDSIEARLSRPDTGQSVR